MSCRCLLLVCVLLLPALPACAVVYERQQSDIIFNHKQHTENLSLPCAECHEVRESDRASDRLLPREAVCLSCHDGERAAAGCDVCHRSPDAPVSYPPERRLLHFSHRKHLAISEVNCETCHSGIAASTSSQAGLPKMETCLTCHDGLRQSVECALCHTDPEVVTAKIHPDGWEEDHRIAANIDLPRCESCHRTDDRCSLCHEGDNLRGQIHPFNWDVLHASEARGRATDCTSCHDTQLFCVHCHTSRGVEPATHLGADWLTRHADEARFDPESCDACHSGGGPSCAGSGCHSY